MTLTVTDDSFEKEVLQSDKPVLVDFYADWCGPCKSMASPLAAFAAQKADKFKTVKVDVEQSKALVSKYNIRALPTLMVFRNGVPVAQAAGAKNAAQLNFFTESALGQPEGAKIDPEAQTRQRDAQEAEKLRVVGTKTIRFFAAASFVTGLVEVVAGSILIAASGGAAGVLGGALIAHGALEMTTAPKVYQNAEKVIEAGIQAENNIEGETIAQKKARQAAFAKQWDRQTGPAFLATKPAKLAVGVLRFAAGAALFPVFPAGILHGLACGFMALGGLDVFREARSAVDALAHKIKPAPKAAAAEEAQDETAAKARPDTAPQPRSTLSDKTAASDFSASAQKEPPANENRPVQTLSKQEKHTRKP
jgi:thioredoxin 1